MVQEEFNRVTILELDFIMVHMALTRMRGRGARLLQEMNMGHCPQDRQILAARQPPFSRLTGR